MGQITIFIKEDDPHSQALRLDLKECRLPFQEIVLDPSEPQNVPEIFFDNYPITGGIRELLTILKNWEIVPGPDGNPTLQPIPQSTPQSQPAYDRWNERASSRNLDTGGNSSSQHRRDQASGPPMSVSLPIQPFATGPPPPSSDDFHQRVHYRDLRRQQMQSQQQNYTGYSRRDELQGDSYYQRHSFHGRGLQNELYHHYHDNHGGYSGDESPVTRHLPIRSRSDSAKGYGGRAAFVGPPLTNNDHRRDTYTSHGSYSSRAQPISQRNTDNPGRVTLQGGLAEERHTNHGKEVIGEVRRQERYNDDNDPFGRPDASSFASHGRNNNGLGRQEEQVQSIYAPERHSYQESSMRRIYEGHSTQDGAQFQEQKQESERVPKGRDQHPGGSFAASKYDSLPPERIYCEASPSHDESQSDFDLTFAEEEDNIYGDKKTSIGDDKDDDLKKTGASAAIGPPLELHDSAVVDSNNQLHDSQASLTMQNLNEEEQNNEMTPISNPQLSQSSLNSSLHGSSANISLAASDSLEDLECQEKLKDGGKGKQKKTGISILKGTFSGAGLTLPFRRTSSSRPLGSKMSSDSTDSAEIGPHSPGGSTKSNTAETCSASPLPIDQSRSRTAKIRAARLMRSARSLSNRSLMSRLNDSNSSLYSRNDDNRLVTFPNGNLLSVLEATLELQRIIPRSFLKHDLGILTYKNSFSGSTVVDSLQEAYGLSREEAHRLGRSLYQAKLLRHVSSDHEFVDTGKLIFRLQCHQTPEILNSFCVWQDESTLTRSGGEVMRTIISKLCPLMTAITDTKGRVHYSHATKQHDDLVAELDFVICELQMVKLARMDKKSLLAFGLNVFQVFMHYAFIKVGIPASSAAYTSFWTNLKFNVGGDMYSFSDWWNGICRGNRKGPYGGKPFQGKDSRMYLNVTDPVDPRVHFAAAMTHFMRPMFVYSGAQIDKELDHVAQIYCQNAEFVWMEISSNTLTLAPFFQTYSSDFATSKHGLPKALVPHMTGIEKTHIDEMLRIKKKIKVEFHNDGRNDSWDEYAGEHFMYQSTPKADLKPLVHKKHDAPRTEVKRRGSITALFRLEGAPAS